MSNKLCTAILITFLFFIGGGFFTSPFLHAAPNDISYTLITDQGDAITNASVYVFTEDGSYTGQNSSSDINGIAYFDSINFSQGNYRFRADFRGYQFWSDLLPASGAFSHNHTIPHYETTVSVSQVINGQVTALPGLKTYLFLPQGSYLGVSQTTNDNGQVSFNLPDMDYKIRVDYLGQQFWSDTFKSSDTTVHIPAADIALTVTGAGSPLADVSTYVFSEDGSYLNINTKTDSSGKAVFRLPASGTYVFRADYLGNQYWSEKQTFIADQTNPLQISTGGGTFIFTLLGDATTPLAGIKCYLFNEAGTYLGLNETTDTNGQISFGVADGSYKIRVDYQGYQFWSAPYTVPTDLSGTLILPHQDLTVNVVADFQGTDTNLSGIKTYLFSPSGSYLSQSQTTDANGQVVFNLPDQEYKVRADYLGQQFWSDVFRNADTTVSIPVADAEITVTGAGLPLADVKVYAFSEDGAYLNLSTQTDSGGQAIFRLPTTGTYKFRADHLGSQYWSEPQTLIADQTNPIEISTGGGTFTFTLLKDSATPVTGIKCYLFNEAESYLNMNGTTDFNGQVSFNVADGTYKIRTDYLGYQFWSELYTAPAQLSGTVILPHQDITITVAQKFQGADTNLSGIKTYLFSPSGSYLSQSQTTNTNGQVVFNLPNNEYKIRTDYMGQQYWSDLFISNNTSISIASGQAEIHVQNAQTDIANAKVYLFTDNGTYLNHTQTTDASGRVTFTLPTGLYLFRIDVNGEQHWSNTANIAKDNVAAVNIDLSPLSVTLNTDSPAIQVGDEITLFWTSVGANSCSIEPDIGPVALNGSITVIPEASTTYTITATGTNGIATSTAQVSVVAPSFPPKKFTSQEILSLDEIYFGASVAVSGDYAVIGAPLTDVNGKQDSGAVFIFKKEGSSWVEKTKITASDGQENECFGSSVAINDDTIIVGAPYAAKLWSVSSPNYHNAAGAVYIYKLVGETWVEQTTRLHAENVFDDELFGYSVAISNSRIIVGTENAGASNFYTPRVVIFHFDGFKWTQQAEFSPSDPESYWHYGYSVDISGNYAAVGAPYNMMYGDTGFVYVYKFNGTQWIEDSVLMANDGERRDYLGWSVAISGDYIITGAPGNSIEGTAPPPGEIPAAFTIDEGGGTQESIYKAGAAYIFKRDANGWTEQAKLEASDAADWLSMGLYVDIYDDYALVGSDYNINNNSYENANYLYKRFGSRWVEQGILYGGINDYQFFGGPSIAISSDTILLGDTDNHPSDIYPQIAGDPYFMPGATFAYDLPKTTVTLTASPPIDPNGESVLSWTTQNASSCVIDQGIGTVALNGSIPVKTTDTITYTATVQGVFGTGTDSATVIVGYPVPELTLSAPPAPLLPGESTTISWSTTQYTDSLTIDNGIGSVPVNGSIQVSPDSTTIYTLTASGPGGTDIKSITVSVVPPSVSLTATPAAIDLGQPTTLTWSSSYADSVSIDNGIGSVTANGTLSLTPTSSKTYTITATGPSGTTTAQASVTVIPPKPTIDFTSTAYAVLAGESVTLSWQTEFAESVILGYGLNTLPVGPNSMLTLSPSSTTTYRVEATNTSGTSIEAITVTVLNPNSLGVAIQLPIEGATINIPQTIVQGIVTTSADEVGVVVNGYPAQVKENKWFVNNLPLTEGANTITATATQPDGSTASHSIFVTVDTSTPTDWIELHLSPESGITPLTTNVKIEPHLSFTPTSLSVGTIGPGQDVTMTSTSDTEHELTFPTPGFYTLIFTMSDDQGNEVSEEIMVHAVDGAVLDALLKSRWDGLKSKLAVQDIDGALGYFLSYSQDKYRDIISELFSKLPQIATDMNQSVEMIYSESSRAKFRIYRNQIINGTPENLTFFIYFIRDENGLWKIEKL